MFEDRIDAGLQLAEEMPVVDRRNTVVLALPRGGVPVAAVIAEKLDVPLDVILVKKIGAPGQPELALGAVSKRGDINVTVNRDIASEFGLSDRDINDLAQKEIPGLEQRTNQYLGDRQAVPLRDKTVIVVDDGVATGATMVAALDLIRQSKPERLIAALPVAPIETVSRLKEVADDVICLFKPMPFFSVGSHYRDFTQVDDADVVAALSNAGR